MGNGYTFSLETLIFAAACRAVGSRQYAVYGDDIVIETELAARLIKLLSFLGFITNKEKSFIDPANPFRESCGCDYINGVLVTPWYMREVPYLRDKSSLCHLINGLVSVSYPGPLWETLKGLVENERLRLIPHCEESRAGVWITPHFAWRLGKLRLDRRPTRKGKVNPDFGFPTFEGYGQVQDVRRTSGWRSLLLWHLRKVQSPEISLKVTPNRFGELLLASRGGESDLLPDEVVVTSRVVVRSRFVHKTRRYFPVRSTTPGILFLWDEVLGA
jgi:hypothetical protein